MPPAISRTAGSPTAAARKNGRELVRYALVGTGSVAGWHAVALRAVPNARLDVVVSRDIPRAQAFAARHRIPRAERFSERIFENLPVDAVLVATEPEFHAAAGLAAARAGKHVMVEKPMEATVEAARRLIDECKRAGVWLTVVAQKRFDPRYRLLKELLPTGTLGTFRLGHVEFISHRPASYYEDRPWRKGPSGGILLNHLIHWIDLWLDLLGSPDETASWVERVEGGYAESATCCLLYRRTGMVTLHGTVAHVGRLPTRFVYVGSQGRFEWEGMRCEVKGPVRLPWSWRRWCLASRRFARLVPSGELVHQLTDWTESLLRNRPPLVSPEAGLEALHIALSRT